MHNLEPLDKVMFWWPLLLALGILGLTTAEEFVHPIEIKGRSFIDSVTGEPFLIRGVDYQPGGSSGYYGRADPLSDPDICARDVFLFRKLGINAIRVYTVNPELDHNECMTMLAASGIYLILDVNSPRMGESLNRYEPWTTYGKEYLSHVFQVVESFSGYNNTLGFFAGNEVINDDRSATVSPRYVKAVIRDVKRYIKHNSDRTIPVGYSAADDLRYRVSLAKYLECGDNSTAVDFYGVNSYQWCGENTFQSSGYDILLADYVDFAMPVFLSEYGCNIVMPRQFQEVKSLYTDMMPVFSGGLVYEFSQEPNNYGLVELDHKNNVYLLEDFHTLEEVMKSSQPSIKDMSSGSKHKDCLAEYQSIETSPLPETFGGLLIADGVQGVQRGRYVQLSTNTTSFSIFDKDNVEILEKGLNIPLDWANQFDYSFNRSGNRTSTPMMQHSVSQDAHKEEKRERGSLFKMGKKLDATSDAAAVPYMISALAAIPAMLTLWAMM